MYAKLKQQIIEKSKEIGIDKIGFTTAAPFKHLEASLIEQKERGHTTGFEHPNIQERIYPDKIFDQPRSIISIALAYPTKLASQPKRIKGEKRGSFARVSWGTDYHDILRERLDTLKNFITDISQQEVNFKPMVDTGELIDVAVAQRAGVGFIGKNGLLITEEFGSYVYLGEMITNIPFEPDRPIENKCGSCTRCIDLCPTQALLGDGRMNGKKCLSYQTQTKELMPKEYRKKIRTIIYGCDICQEVCPFNKGKNFHFHPEMEPDPEIVKPLLKPLLTISNKEFKQTYGHLSGSWRGKKPIQRNAILALGNSRDKSAVPHLLKCLAEDVRPVIRGSAAWAIGEIVSKSNEELILFFKKQLAQEKEQEVCLEIQAVLQSWQMERGKKDEIE